MSNYTPGSLSGDLAPVNSELTKISEAISDQLDRNPSGSGSNSMLAPLDMNGLDILNLPKPTNPTSPVRMQDIPALPLLSLLEEIREEVQEDAQAAELSAAAAEASSASVPSVDATVRTSSFTAEAGKIYLVDTSGGGFSVALPMEPSFRSVIGFIDLKGTFEENPVVLTYNFEKIMRLEEDNSLDINNLSIELVYTGSTDGWIYK